jgi:hypothetical protein
MGLKEVQRIMSTGQKQKVSTLRFYLYDRPLHPELFDIYYDHQVTMERYEAQLWVTGCTHVIAFHSDGQSLVEVTADADCELPRHGIQLELPFRGEKAHETLKQWPIHYMMNFQVESMSPMAYSRTHHELARLGARRGLFVPFPTWRSRSLTPFTFIDYEVRPDQLHVFTFHAFPDDLTMVRTQSIFELKRQR